MNLTRILIINPFGIGDVLFTTPVVSNLKRAYPQSQITYLCNRRNADILRANGDIHQVMVYERDEFVAVYRQNPFAFFLRWKSFVGEIKDHRFDAVIDFSLNTSFGFVALLAGIKKRIGFDYKGRGRFLTEKIPLIGFQGKHVVEHYLEVLKFLGIPVVNKELCLDVPQADLEWAKQWALDQGIEPNKPLVALVPGGGASWGAGAKNKRWPSQNYAQLADKIIAKYDATVILMGDPKEIALSQEVARQADFPLYVATGATSVLQMAALMRLCRFVVVNDGGPLHIAVASQVKTVSIFGPVDPIVYGPYPKGNHQVIQKGLACQPCYQRFRMAQCAHINCLNQLSVEEVYRKVEGLL